jgi:hypothetical protein
LHSGDAGGVVDAILRDQRGVALANSGEAQFQDRLGKRRLSANGGAASNTDRRRQKGEVDELAALNRQVGNLLSLNHLA